MLADMTTGLSKAMEAYNKGQMDQVDKHLGIIDRMVAMKKMGYDLELARLKYTNKGMDPYDLVKMRKEEIELRRAEELEKAENEVIATMVQTGKWTEPEATRYVKGPEKVSAGYAAMGAGKEYGAKEAVPGSYTKPIEAEVKKAEVDLRTGEAQLAMKYPEKTTEADVAKATGSVEREPLETEKLGYETQIKSVEAEFERKKTIKELAKLDAEAEFLGKKDTYQPMDQYMQLQDKERMILKLLNDYEEAKAEGKEGLWEQIFSQQYGDIFPSAGITSGSPELAKTYLEQQLNDIKAMKNTVKEGAPESLTKTKEWTLLVPPSGPSEQDKKNRRELEARGYTVRYSPKKKNIQKETRSTPNTESIPPANAATKEQQSTKTKIPTVQDFETMIRRKDQNEQ